jgi:hypothetical protein
MFERVIFGKAISNPTRIDALCILLYSNALNEKNAKRDSDAPPARSDVARTLLILVAS